MSDENLKRPSLPGMRQRLGRLLPYFHQSRWGLFAAFCGSVVGALTEPLIPALMKPLLDSGFKSLGFSLWLIPVVVIGLFAIRGLAGFVAHYALAWSANQGVQSLRTALFDRLLNAQPALFAQHQSSSLINTLTFEIQNGASQLVHSLLSLVKDSLTLLALLAYLMWLNPLLTLFVAVLFPAVALVMRTLSKRVHRLSVLSQTAGDDLAYVVEENVLGWRAIRLNGADQAQAQRFAQANHTLGRLSLKSVAAQATMTPITQIMAACALSAVIVMAVWQSTQQQGSVGGFVAFVTAMLMLVAPIKHLSELAGPITRSLAALERGIALLDQNPVESSGNFKTARARGDLAFENVSLQYRPDTPPALNQLNLSVRAGETVALVGPSGAGKSSLIHLLPRWLEPTSGTVQLDDHALADWDVRALRQQFALVSQDLVLFNTTLAANVALGSMPPDAKRVLAALNAAHLLSFAQSLPQGVDTLIGHNGHELSGGQRQRLGIARAIYKDAPILILDEATSALDTESERLVQAALGTLMSGRTCLVIAHRLSTIERADRIAVLQAGQVVELGSHRELLQQNGLYARLHALQFKAESTPL
jgi:ATP-binding cassette, subfamily B, bacterial MsbA